MSRFFKGSDNSSSDESEEDVMTSDEEIETSSQVSDESVAVKKVSGAARFLRGAADSDEDSDEDGVKKVVKSAKDKKVDEMRSIAKTILNALKIQDWVNLSNEYDKLVRLVARSGSAFEAAKAPRFFIRLMIDLEDAVKSASSKESVKKMNALSAKALSAMKQKLKKEFKTFEDSVASFKAKPVNEEESEDEADQLAMAEFDEESEDEKVEEVEDDAGFTFIGKGGKAIEMNSEMFFMRLAELLAARGKKNTDKLGQVQSLLELVKHVKTPYQNIKLLLALLSSRFDYIPPSTGYMATDMWKSALDELSQLFDLFHSNKTITTGSKPEDDTEPEHVRDARVTAGDPYVVCVHLVTFVDQLDDEIYKSLQAMVSPTSEYVDRLRDESRLYAMIVRAQCFYEALSEKDQDILDLLMMRRLEHLYYKPNVAVQLMQDSIKTHWPAAVPSSTTGADTVSALCSQLYKTSIDRIRTRSLLCHVYHLCLIDRYQSARDLMLMSHLPDNISFADIPTQILYNRAMAQLGMCAFRAGLFKECALALQDIAASGKTKELLAQGILSVKGVEKTIDQENLERLRQLPFHMHINLELLECIYLTTSMLLEVPHMALHTHDSRRRMISRSFRRMLEHNDRQVFVGPPENTRDYIMAAGKAMIAGEWKQCRDFILSIKIWKLVPNSEAVMSMLASKINEETLRTFVFSFSSRYESFSLASLSSMFQVPLENVYGIIAKMIMTEELHASLNTVDGVQMDSTTENSELSRAIVVLHQPSVDISKLEYLATTYCEKISNLLDTNEKLLESKAVGLGLDPAPVSTPTTRKQPASGSKNVGFRFKNGKVDSSLE